MPADLAAVQADDALLDMIGAGHAPSDADDELTRVLAAWRDEVHAEPVRELVDTSTALALIRAAARRPVRRRRSPVFGSIAGAAAVLVIAFSSVGLVAKSAEPGDDLWNVTQVLYPEYTRSVETAAAVRTELNEATTALRQGNPERARAALQNVQKQLPVIGEKEGRTDLTARHRQLEQKLNGPLDTGKGNFPGGPVFPPPVPAGSGPGTPRDPGASYPEEPDPMSESTGQVPGSPSRTNSDQYLPGRDFPGNPYPYPGAGNPGGGAPDRGAPDRDAPDRGAPGRGAPGRDAPGRDTRDRDAPDRDAPDRDAQDRDDPGNGSSPGEAVPGGGTVNQGGSTSGTGTPGGNASGGSTSGAPPSPNVSPAPSPSRGPAGAPGSGHVSGSGPRSSGFPGCDRPPPRPGYCG